MLCNIKQFVLFRNVIKKKSNKPYVVVKRKIKLHTKKKLINAGKPKVPEGGQRFPEQDR